MGPIKARPSCAGIHYIDTSLPYHHVLRLFPLKRCRRLFYQVLRVEALRNSTLNETERLCSVGCKQQDLHQVDRGSLARAPRGHESPIT